MRRFGYYWKEGLRNIFKHGFMSIAAIAIMVACLILTGTVTLIAYNIDLSIVDLQQSNEIVVWIDENLTTREAKDLQPQFEKISNIATVEFEDRDVALEKYREELGADASILEDYNSSNNPLRNSYILTLKDSTKAEETIADIGMIEGVASVRADEAVIGKLIQIQHVFNIIALAMVAGLAVISIFIISNTVKLAMFARREEISIQKMVGATNWFIRWPFVIEGMIIGLIAGGDTALRNPVEAAEDNTNQGWKDLEQFNINDKDTVIGIAASGTTPYVIGALEECRRHGILTAAITSNPDAPISAAADIAIEMIVGPEYVTGSSRMKSGTGQKMICNMITTSVMIQMGRVKGNKMVNMQLTNAKLVDRGTRMIVEELGLPYDDAKRLLLMHGSVKKAIDAYRGIK